MNESPLSGRLARAVILLLMPLAPLRGQTGFDATVSGTTTEVVPIALVGAVTGYRIARCGVAVE